MKLRVRPDRLLPFTAIKQLNPIHEELIIDCFCRRGTGIEMKGRRRQ